MEQSNIPKDLLKNHNIFKLKCKHSIMSSVLISIQSNHSYALKSAHSLPPNQTLVFQAPKRVTHKPVEKPMFRKFTKVALQISEKYP